MPFFRLLAVYCWLVLFAAAAPATALEILGTKPSHIKGDVSQVANEQAITKAIWAPGIDDGYVPQGITFADGALLLSSYKSTSVLVDTGPCRVYQINIQSGQTIGQFDMPDTCGHAGGLAYAGDNNLIVADGRWLYQLDMKRAFADGHTKNALRATLKLAGELKASFADCVGTSLFIGAYVKKTNTKITDPNALIARGFFLPLSLFDTHNGKTIREDVATSSFAIGSGAQGAAFDASGNLWLSFSGSKFGALQKLNPKSGEVMAKYEMVIGIEDLGVDNDGKLWSVSEAGSRRWSAWSQTFPLLFQMDVRKLK